MIIRPQEKQEQFLSSSADICVYGGSAGGGKSWSLLVEPLRHINNPKFRCVIFRRTMPQIMNSGGLLDASQAIYRNIPGAVLRKNPRPHWIFPSGATIYFAHLERDDTVYDWQGTEITLIEFDEVTHFTENQFWYMLSRNRGMAGIAPYVRCSCNPDPDSFVRKLLDWWIDPNTGYAIPERSGIIRYMARVDGEIVWGDSRRELMDMGVESNMIKSFTFIMSSIYDNQALLKNNPDYLANLKALPTVEQERLLSGNWNIRPAAGLYFPRNKVTLIDEIPDDVVRWVRAWDLAGTEDKKNNNPEDGPAYTAGVLMGKRRSGGYVVADVINQRLNASEVRNLVLNTAKADKAAYKSKYRIRMNQDPGQAGKDQAEQYIKLLSGFSVNIERETGSKETRAEPFSAQWIGVKGAEKGNVYVLNAPWTAAYLAQCDGFPDRKFKDMCDASNTAFLELEKMNTSSGPPVSTGSPTAKQSYWFK